MATHRIGTHHFIRTYLQFSLPVLTVKS